MIELPTTYSARVATRISVPPSATLTAAALPQPQTNSSLASNSNGYNGEEYFNIMSSFVKKEWLFDKISGKIEHRPDGSA